jgi:drug/metabolite transporter (DMT)-like permease
LAGRAFFAIVGLLVYLAATERRSTLRAFRLIGIDGLAVAMLMAIASGSFIVALNFTSVANVLFMQALSPILAAILGTLFGESVTRRTWVAIAVAFAGVIVMVGTPGNLDPAGELLAFIMTLSFAGTLVLTRHRRDVSMAPATCLSQLIVLLAAAPFATLSQISGHDVALLSALGISQIGLGLVFLTIGARLIAAAEVAIIVQLEIVLGPLWVWLAVDERPSTATLVGGIIVLGAVALQTLEERSN